MCLLREIVLICLPFKNDAVELIPDAHFIKIIEIVSGLYGIRTVQRVLLQILMDITFTFYDSKMDNIES